MTHDIPEQERALKILKTKGPQPLKAVAASMGVTTEGARFHLLKLEKEGLVRAHSEAKGRGRPKKIWSLTKKGHSRFPDSHAQMTSTLINRMRETLGEEALEKVVDAHEDHMMRQYQQALDPCQNLEERLEKLTEIRSREGYMAAFQKKDRGYVFVENHCPICTAAETCQGFCRAELNIFRAVLGDDVQVKREEHIIKGARRCAYLVTQN